ncbi:MAG: MarP family serine protease, partial [Sciscionella sp.]
LNGFQQGLTVSVAALLFVLLCAFVGQAVAVYVGHRVRSRVTWRPARLVDALSGSALSVAAMLLIAWVLGVAASGAQLSGLNQEVRNSVVLGEVDRVLPGNSGTLLSTFSSIVDSSQFPRYLEPFTPELIRAVPAPPKAVARRPGVQRAAQSVVKILGAAESCSRSLEGSGFVYRPGRVMTNAHVVAGVPNPIVRIDDTDYRARVVYYDPEIDVAVLDVPGLPAPALRFGGTRDSGDPAAVLGYPEDGPFNVQPARIRDEQTLRSPDIYGNGTVYRDTYSIYSLVREGNSGGPLVSPSGQVIGVVFAASLTNSRTGYALTSKQVQHAASAGSRSTARVGTGGCAS